METEREHFCHFLPNLESTVCSPELFLRSRSDLNQKALHPTLFLERSPKMDAPPVSRLSEFSNPISCNWFLQFLFWWESLFLWDSDVHRLSQNHVQTEGSSCGQCPVFCLLFYFSPKHLMPPRFSFLEVFALFYVQCPPYRLINGRWLVPLL